VTRTRLGDPDTEHLAYAADNDWILVTFDDDFLSLVENSDFDHAGIIYVQQAGRDIGDVVKATDKHLESRDKADRSIHYC
jgi:predicted nuclease of predicted toxin-antitoxin system